MTYSPDQDYYRTNPAAAICEYYGIEFDELADWHVPYEAGFRRVVEGIVITMYRLASGTYEAVTYKTCNYKGSK